MAKYGADYSAVTNTNAAAIWTLYQPASALRRLKIYEFNFGSSGTPNDYACGYSLKRTSAAPTPGTSVTPGVVDYTDTQASGALFVGGGTAGTAIGSTVIWRQAVNLRASYRWVANPGCEFVVAITNNQGINMLAAQAGTTFGVDGSVNFWEE